MISDHFSSSVSEVPQANLVGFKIGGKDLFDVAKDRIEIASRSVLQCCCHVLLDKGLPSKLN